MTPENAMLTLVQTAAGDVPVFVSGLADPVPPPCIAMTVRWVEAGPAETGRVDDDGKQTVHDHRDATVELRSAGRAAYDALDTMDLILRHPVFEDQAEALDLALFRVGRLERVPPETGVVASEPQGLLELGIRYTHSYSDQVGVIETVTGTIVTTGGLKPALHTSFSAKTDTAR